MIVKSDQIRHVVRQRLLLEKVMEMSSRSSSMDMFLEQEGDDKPSHFEKGLPKITTRCGTFPSAILSILPAVGTAVDVCDFIAHMKREELVLAILTLACMTPVVGGAIALIFKGVFKIPAKGAGAIAKMLRGIKGVTVAEAIIGVAQTVSKEYGSKEAGGAAKALPDHWTSDAAKSYLVTMWDTMINMKGGVDPLVELTERVVRDVADDVPGSEAMMIFLSAQARMISEQVVDSGPAAQWLANMIRGFRNWGVPGTERVAGMSEELIKDARRLSRTTSAVIGGRGTKIIGASATKTVVIDQWKLVADAFRIGTKAIDDKIPLAKQLDLPPSNELIRTWDEIGEKMGIPISRLGAEAMSPARARAISNYLSGVIGPLQRLSRIIDDMGLRVVEPYTGKGQLKKSDFWRGLGAGTGKLRAREIEELISPMIDESMATRGLREELGRYVGSARAAAESILKPGYTDPTKVLMAGERAAADTYKKLMEWLAKRVETVKPAINMKNPLALASAFKLSITLIYGTIWIALRWGAAQVGRFTDFTVKSSETIIRSLLTHMNFNVAEETIIAEALRYQVRTYPKYKLGLQALKRMWSAAAGAVDQGDPSGAIGGALGSAAFDWESIPWSTFDRIKWSILPSYQSGDEEALDELNDTLEDFGINMRSDTLPGDLGNLGQDIARTNTLLDGSGRPVPESFRRALVLAEIL